MAKICCQTNQTNIGSASDSTPQPNHLRIGDFRRTFARLLAVELRRFMKGNSFNRHTFLVTEKIRFDSDLSNSTNRDSNQSKTCIAEGRVFPHIMNLSLQYSSLLGILFIESDLISDQMSNGRLIFIAVAQKRLAHATFGVDPRARTSASSS